MTKNISWRLPRGLLAQRSGTLLQRYQLHTSLDEVPTMANYQATHNFSPSHRGDNNPEDQSKGMPHPAHHIQGVMGNAMTHPLFTQIYAGSEGEVME